MHRGKQKQKKPKKKRTETKRNEETLGSQHKFLGLTCYFCNWHFAVLLKQWNPAKRRSGLGSKLNQGLVIIHELRSGVMIDVLGPCCVL